MGEDGQYISHHDSDCIFRYTYCRLNNQNCHNSLPPTSDLAEGIKLPNVPPDIRAWILPDKDKSVIHFLKFPLPVISGGLHKEDCMIVKYQEKKIMIFFAIFMTSFYGFSSWPN